MRLTMAAVGILFLLPAASSSQDDKKKPNRPGQAHPDVDQDKVNKAIDMGAKYLLGKSGSLEPLPHPTEGAIGQEELVLLTLIHADVDPSDGDFEKLLDKVLDKPLIRTYEVSLRAMALEALDREKYRDHLVNCGQWLADNQCENGQWSYGEKTDLPVVKKPPKDVATKTGGAFQSDDEIVRIRKSKKEPGQTKAMKKIVKRRKGPPSGDNSNSQYAALGVRACMRAGVELEAPILNRALKWWMDSQQDDGGWHYSNTRLPSDRSWGSMTAGAACSMIIYLHWLKKDYAKSPQVLKSIKWVGDKFTVKENPNFMYPQIFHYYWLYAVERLGMLLGTEKFGTHDWYPEGAKMLLEAQKSNGSWKAPGLGAGGAGALTAGIGSEIVDTCFAILFLRRATAPLKDVVTEDKKK